MNESLRSRILIPNSHYNDSLSHFFLLDPTRLEHRHNRRDRCGVGENHLRSAILPLVAKLRRGIRTVRQRRLESCGNGPKQRKGPSETVRAEYHHCIPSRDLYPSQPARKGVPETPSEGETSGLELRTCDGASGWRVDERRNRAGDLTIDLSLE